MNRTSMLSICLAVATTIFGQNQRCERKSCCDQDQSIAQNCYQPGYNASARYDVCDCWDAYVAGSFIYWQGMEKGLDIAFIDTNPNTGNGFQNTENVRFNAAGYKPGFKLGLGFNSEFDNWDLYLEYLRLNFTDSKSVNAPTGAGDQLTVPFWFNSDNTGSITNGDNASYLSGRWKLNLNVFDFELARRYYVGTHLTARPHVGARGGWNDQHYDLTGNFTAVGGEKRTSYSKSDSWFVGPRMGLDTDWNLYCGFRAIGNWASSLVYTKFDVTNVEDSIDPAAIGNASYGTATTTIRSLQPNMEFALGFGWGDYFSRNAWHFDIQALYEFHIFWSQNVMKAFLTGTTPEDLMLHGLTITARFDF